MTPRRTPPGRRLGRLALALVAGACGALAWVGGGPAVADGPCGAAPTCLVVHLDGASRVVSTAELADWVDVTDRPTYRMRYEPGRPPEDQSDFASSYLSVRHLVEQLASEAGPFAGLDPGSLGLVTLRFPGRPAEVQLEPPALGPAGSNGYVDARLPAFYTDTDRAGTAFVRPLLEASPGGPPSDSDVNGRDLVQPTGGAVDMYLSEDARRLSPTASATPSPAQVGRPVTFAATLADAPAGTTYSWDLGDGASATGGTVRHAFDRTSGSGYVARVTAVAPDGSRGTAAVRVVVRDPEALEPRIEADPARPEAGEEVRFSVTGAPAGARYAWTIEGERPAAAAPTHVFEEKGRFPVAVTVTGDGRTGSDTLVVVVGAPRDTGGDDTGGGGDGGSDGGNGGPDNPTDGPDDGTGGRAGGAAEERPGGPPTTPTDPSTPPPVGAATPPGGGLTGVLLTGAATPFGAQPETEDLRAARETAEAQQARKEAAAAARAGTAAGAAGAGRSLPWAAAVALALLGLGVLREMRGPLRLRTSSARAMMSR